MTKYSSADILNEEQGEGFLDKVIRRLTNSKEVYLYIKVPASLHFRAEILCEDIEELSDFEFKQHNLIAFLYYDFLTYCKTNPNLDIIYNKLLHLESKNFPIRSYTNDTTKKNLTNLIKEVKTKKVDEKILEIRFHKKEVLRGEVLLADLYEIYPQHLFNLEQILELIYCDFIVKIKRGEGEESLKSIVKSLIND